MDNPEETFGDDSLRKTRILIVDDSKLMQNLILAAIDSESYEIRTADDGAKAIEMIDEWLPDLVLLDQQMPGMSGNEVLKFLKSNEQTRGILVIMVTGTSDAKMIKKSLRLGAIEFIAKPFSVDILRARVQNVVRTSSLLREQKLLRRSADAANRSKSEFLANMSHEIRTPMTAILGYAEILLNEEGLEKAPASRVEALQTIQRNGQFLLEIINDILDLSKIESEKMVMENIDCSPHKIISDVAQLMQVRASSKGLPLLVEYDGPIPERMHSDPTRLRQILINLVGNAIKFTEQGKVRLVARTLEVKGEHPKMQFEVVDTGIGMSKEQLQKLFQPFVQVDTSTTRRFGGTGLGLAISKRLSEMLGGTIQVASSVGEGSTFSVTVSTGSLENVKLVEPKEAEESPTAKIVPAHKEAAQIDCRVLLAEDGPDNQRLISFLLKKSGAEVTVAENGQIALDLALEARDREKPFDLILMDMQMPVLDGYGATGKLRESGYTGPIIALTAHAMDGDREKCVKAGCDDYATKPIDRAKLIALVAQYTSKPQHTSRHGVEVSG